MNRRGFLALLATAAVGLAIDPELAAWQPGQRTHILPPADGWKAIHDAQREMNRLRSMQADGLSMRFIRNYDVDSDKWPCRIDILYGVQVLRPELLGRLVVTEGS